MPPIPPSLREKKRYLLGRVFPAGFEPDRKSLHASVQEAVQSLWGDAGAAEISASVIRSGNYAVIRCRRGSEGKLIIAISTVTGVGDARCAIRPVAVSGTIAALSRRIAGTGEPAGFRSIEWSGKTYDACYRPGQKVDLIEKGFKTRELLFLTENDIQE
ncbi:MAG: Rpp14/Pop5 family protein [Methanoregulaceae archaeon]|nr:Rpp14/Pop5 family protein [Methanoregulaceae archaeon]